MYYFKGCWCTIKLGLSGLAKPDVEPDDNFPAEAQHTNLLLYVIPKGVLSEKDEVLAYLYIQRHTAEGTASVNFWRCNSCSDPCIF